MQTKVSTWRWLVRGLIAIVVLLAISPVVCLCPCTQIETERFAELDESAKVIRFVVRGFRACPLTAEGPFPRWAKSATVSIAKTRWPLGEGQETLHLGADFSVQFEAAESGTVEINRQQMQAAAALKYSRHFSWLDVVEGDFPLRVKRQ